jgi:predicted double-glycine peptidase
MKKPTGEKTALCLIERNSPVPRYKQGTEDYACGPVCICIALDYLLTKARKLKLDFEGIKKIEELTMDRKTWSSTGTNYERMKNAIRRMGFGCREIRGKTDDAREDSVRRSISHSNPVILGCRAQLGRRRYRHYVVLTGIDGRYLYIRDPYPEGRPMKVLLENFRKNGNPTSWGNKRWGVEVYFKRK